MGNNTIRILLIDDDRSLLVMCEHILTGLGYNVITHSNGDDALELFLGLPDHFDLIICDYNMPGLDGAELSCKILDVRPDIPIIICTGYYNDFCENDAEKLGIKGYIKKPFVKKDLDGVVQQLLGYR